MERIVLGSLLLVCMVGVVYGVQCGKTPYTGDSSFYPKKQLTYIQLDALIGRGSGGKSKNLYEIYSLQEKDDPPILWRVALYWQKLGPGVYFNQVTGLIPGTPEPFCYNDTVTLRVFGRPTDYVHVVFDIFLPEARTYVGTMSSSCPDRYIISWFCPVEHYDSRKKYCFTGARISILTFEETIDNIPWHLITGDLCAYKSPALDDIRWKFMHRGEYQCQVPDEIGTRKKRYAENYVSAKKVGRHLWP